MNSPFEGWFAWPWFRVALVRVALVSRGSGSRGRGAGQLMRSGIPRTQLLVAVTNSFLVGTPPGVSTFGNR